MVVMSSATQVEDESLTQLPPLFCFNPRKKCLPDWIPVENITEKEKDLRRKYSQLIWAPPRKVMVPKPSHPIQISWLPDIMHFDMEDEVVVHKLCVSNYSHRSLYIHCCGLWGDTARLGAGWRCYPRTRFLLAPGLMGEMFIRAHPRDESPVSGACTGLQLATAHLRDRVTGYFFVPIEVKFGNYKLKNLEECEE